MTNYEDLFRRHSLVVLAIPVLIVTAAAGLAALTSSDALDTALGVVVGALTVIVIALVLAMVWRARNPVVSRPVTDELAGSQPVSGETADHARADADRAALDALEPLRAARDDR